MRAIVVNEPYNTETLAKPRIDEILSFFVNVASANDLAATPAVQTLRESLSTLRRGGNFSRNAATQNWRERITQLSGARTNHDPISSSRNLCLQSFPVFNIWDSMSFIYTICADDVKTDLGAELHLYQFLMIVGALRDCNKYFAKFAGPTIVAANWKVETQNQPLSVAFATTAVGERKDDETREVMAAARKHFMSTITRMSLKLSTPDLLRIVRAISRSILSGLSCAVTRGDTNHSALTWPNSVLAAAADIVRKPFKNWELTMCRSLTFGKQHT